MIVAKPASGPFTTGERLFIIIPVMLASLLHSVTLTTVYVALPNMKGNLSATPDQIGWVITSFLVANAIATAATGWLSVRFGRKLVFAAAIGGFTLASVLCASATTLEELVAWRVLQGLLSAPLLPLSQAIMLDSFPSGKQGVAMSVWSLGMIMGPVLGPTIGAYLTEIYSWRWIFYINAPLGILSFVGVLMAVPEADRRAQRLDWLGFVSLAVAVGSFQLMLDRGQRLDWFEAREIVTYGAVAAASFYVFVTNSATTRQPFLNMAVFRDRNFVIGVCLIFLFGLNVFTTLMLIPLFLQDVQDYPVLAAGIIVSARGVGTMVGMAIVGRLGGHVSYRVLLTASLLIIAGSAAYMTTWTEDAPGWSVVMVNLVGGLGIGMIWVSTTTVTFLTLPASLRTEGAALFALIRAVGASIGISLFIAMLTRETQVGYIVLMEHINPFNDALLSLGEGSPWDLATEAGVARLRGVVSQQAQVIAYIHDFTLLMVTTLLGIPLALLVRKPKRTGGAEG